MEFAVDRLQFALEFPSAFADQPRFPSLPASRACPRGRGIQTD